jgi:hypothetical protein
MSAPALPAVDPGARTPCADGPGYLTALLSFPEGASPASLALILRRELATLARDLAVEPHAVRDCFDAASGLMTAALRDLGPHAPAGTWMAITTDTRLVHHEWASRVLPTTVSWDPHPRLAPFLATSVRVPAIIALLDRHHAVILSLAGGSLSELAHWDVDARPQGAPMHMGSPATLGFHRGTGGTPGADIVARRSDHAADVNLARVRERIRLEAGRDGIVVLGGSREATARLRNELFPGFGSRLLLAEDLVFNSPRHEVRAVATRLLSEWCAVDTAEATTDALARAASPLVAAGDDTVAAALLRGAVRRLIISEDRLPDRDGLMEQLVRLGLGQRAHVEIAQGEAGHRLRREAGGAIAILRFPSAPPEE